MNDRTVVRRPFENYNAEQARHKAKQVNSQNKVLKVLAVQEWITACRKAIAEAADKGHYEAEGVEVPRAHHETVMDVFREEGFRVRSQGDHVIIDWQFRQSIGK